MKQRVYLIIIAALLFVSCSNNADKTNQAANNNATGTVYTCLPCGYNCDTISFSKPGTCSHCQMQLVDKSTIVHKSIDPGALCALDNNRTVFLDVRTPEEFNGTAKEKFGAIRNAINIPLQELGKRLAELEQYKNSDIIVYCSHSHRSPQASYVLTSNGFTNITNMLGGMSVWKEKVKDSACNNKFYQTQ